jgi:hypothetical protein
MRAFGMRTSWLSVVLLLACPGYRTYGSDRGGDKPLDRRGLINALRASGAKVRSGDSVEQPFFGVPGRFVRVEAQDVQVFEYPGEAAVQRDAARVAPDGGSVGGSAMMWAATPHFYRKGRLIVLYVGEDSSVRRLLESVLGPQFAGR